MTFREYIEEHYDVRGRIKSLTSDPIKRFIDSDDFPFDFIGQEDGEYVKMLYYAGGDKTIAVLDLLSYRREDLERNGNTELLELYDHYTENVSIEVLSLLDPVKLNSIRGGSLKDKGDLMG